MKLKNVGISFLVVMLFGLLVMPTASAITWHGWAADEYEGHGTPGEWKSTWTSQMYHSGDVPTVGWTKDWMREDTPTNHIVSACSNNFYSAFQKWNRTAVVTLDRADQSWDAIEAAEYMVNSRPNMMVWSVNQWGLMHGDEEFYPAAAYADVDNGRWHMESCDEEFCNKWGDNKLCGPGRNWVEDFNPKGWAGEMDTWMWNGPFPTPGPPKFTKNYVNWRTPFYEAIPDEMYWKMLTFQSPSGVNLWKTPRMPYGVTMSIDWISPSQLSYMVEKCQVLVATGFRDSPTYLEQFWYAYTYHLDIGTGRSHGDAFRHATIMADRWAEEGSTSAMIYYSVLPYANPVAYSSDIKYKMMNSVETVDAYIGEPNNWTYSLVLNRTSYQHEDSYGVWISITPRIYWDHMEDSTHAYGNMTVKIRQSRDDGATWIDFVTDPTIAVHDYQDKTYFLDEVYFEKSDSFGHITLSTSPNNGRMISYYISDWWLLDNVDLINVTLEWETTNPNIWSQYDAVGLDNFEIVEAWE